MYENIIKFWQERDREFGRGDLDQCNQIGRFFFIFLVTKFPWMKDILRWRSQQKKKKFLQKKPKYFGKFWGDLK